MRDLAEVLLLAVAVMGGFMAADALFDWACQRLTSRRHDHHDR